MRLSRFYPVSRLLERSPHYDRRLPDSRNSEEPSISSPTRMQPSPQSRRSFLVTAASTAAALLLRPVYGETEDLAALTLKRASELIRNRASSPVDLTEACLKRIERYNSALNAFITVTSEQALKTAREMESELRQGRWRGPLHGIPIALKDNVDTAGIRTTAASELFKDRVPSEDAEVVRKL